MHKSRDWLYRTEESVSRGRIIFAVVAVVVVLLVVAGIALSAQSRVPQVTTAKIEKENLTQTVTASGQTEADAEEDVFPPAQGTLKMVNVSDGQQVKAGQALATMDTKPLEAAVEQARAAYLQAVANETRDQARRAYRVKRSWPPRRASPESSAPTRADHRARVAATNEASAATLVRYWTEQAEAGRVTPTAAHQLAAATRPVKRARPAGGGRASQGRAGSGARRIPQRTLRPGHACASSRTSATLSTPRMPAISAAAANLLIAEDNLKRSTLTAPIDGVVQFAGGGGGASLPEHPPRRQPAEAAARRPDRRSRPGPRRSPSFS